MRDLLEQDHREKMDSIRRENNDMKQVVAQYEKTIVELTGNFLILKVSSDKLLCNHIFYAFASI